MHAEAVGSAQDTIQFSIPPLLPAPPTETLTAGPPFITVHGALTSLVAAERPIPVPLLSRWQSSTRFAGHNMLIDQVYFSRASHSSIRYWFVIEHHAKSIKIIQPVHQIIEAVKAVRYNKRLADPRQRQPTKTRAQGVQKGVSASYCTRHRH